MLEVESLYLTWMPAQAGEGDLSHQGSKTSRELSNASNVPKITQVGGDAVT